MSKEQTRASYEVRLDRVADYIHQHLDDDIEAETLAEVACLSPYHWHRIYVAMRGETAAGTVRRLRLLRAADRLANSEAPVKSIAERAGYGSPDAFARAFRESYGQAPVEYRASGSHAAYKAAAEAQDAAGFPVTVETLAETRCASIAHAGSYMQIDRTMEKLFHALATQNALPREPKMLAIYYDDPDLTDVEALRSRACAPIPASSAIAPPLEDVVVPGGRYARLRYKGPYVDMKGAYRWLLGVWLPQSGHEPADAPVFETYLNSPLHTKPTDLLTDIHLPLRAS